MNKTILITGCSTGIGKVTAKYFAEKGWNVVATMRNAADGTELSKSDNILVTKLDVTDEASIKDAVAQTVEKFGQIDVLLNNAGYGIYGILEATPEQAIRKQFDVNVIGLLMVTKHALPYMRKAGKGIIINVSSIGGQMTFPLGTLYHGSKFAVEGMSEALSFELASIGIKVKLVEPGMINTNFADTVNKGFNVDPQQTEYVSFVEKVLAGMQQAGSQPSEAIVVAEKIYEAATDGKKQLRYRAGADAEQLLDARKKLNDADFTAMMEQNMGIN